MNFRLRMRKQKAILKRCLELIKTKKCMFSNGI